MKSIITIALLLGSGDIYTSYPVFGDNEPSLYKDKRVNVVRDKGLVRELTVQCTPKLDGILIHDVISNQFCDSKNQCHSKLTTAIRKTCEGAQ